VETPAILFYVFGALSVISALAVVLNTRNTVASAMSLVVTMVSLGIVYVLLEAYLVAVLQIMVYGGAIVVLFLFVVMFLNLRRDDFPPLRFRLTKVAGVVLALAVLARLIQLLTGRFPEARPAPTTYGSYRELGLALYTDYVLLVEMAGLLLLAAIVGALILAKRKID
jgi:NADH-quinone oxidoreductase subunit J